MDSDILQLHPQLQHCDIQGCVLATSLLIFLVGDWFLFF